MAKARNLASYLSGLSANALSADSGSITSNFGAINTGSSTITTTGAITAGSFVIGSADINENDLEAIDGVTAGTIAASKVVTVDTNKDVSAFRNLTATGTITAANLDISADVDIDGTLEADAITVDSVALNEYIADTVGAMVSSNTETNVTVTYEDSDNTLDFAVDFSSLQTALTFGISNTNAVKIDSADVADNEYARFTSNGLESRSVTEVRSDLNVADGANAYVHPNHSGEVTSTADGATVIADNVVDEANLKVSNSPTDGYFLSAQSGNTGGLTWATVLGDVADDSSPQLGGDLDLVTHSIVTTSDRDVNLVPNGSGSVHVQTTTSANALKITETDAGTGQGPTLRLNRNSSSPADSDYLGGIDFYGKNSANEDFKYAALIGQTSDVTDGTEDGKIAMWSAAAGSFFKCAEIDRFRLKAQYTGQYRNYLAAAAASDSSTLSINGYMSSAYKIYEILLVNIVPVTNGVDLLLNCGNGGSEITQHYGYYNVFAGTSGSDASQTDSQILASGTGGMSSQGRWKISGKDEFDVGNTSAEGYTGLIRLYHTQDSSRYVNGHVDHCAYQSDDGYAVNSYISTFRGNFGSTLVTDINLAFDSGNISSGAMYLYGIYVG